MAKTRIMLVEDEAITAMDIQTSLEKLDYEVPAVSSSGVEAVRMADEFRPDLILMDITLSGNMTGIEAARQIRIAHQIPIIFLTAHRDDETLAGAKTAEPYGYLTKPCSLDNLKNTIEVAIYKSDADARVRESEDRYRTLSDELESRVRERTAELELLNRELEGFCYAISHEFRAPIARLEGFGNLLLEIVGEDAEEPLIHCGQRIVVAGKRLRTVIDSLLTLNRLSRADILLSAVNLSEISQQIVAESLEQIENRIIDIKIAPDIIVQGDRYMLELCMRNLLGNAVKYTSNTVEASIEFGKISNEGIDIYYVRDNGIGFDMKYVKNLFVPFCRIHNESEFEGAGIGLATVLRIIDKHNGRIWAEAEQGKGATFYFTIGVGEGEGEI